MAKELLGTNCKLFRNTGSWASPVWVEVAGVRDATTSLERPDAEINYRGITFVTHAIAAKRLNAEAELVWASDNAGQQAIRDAYLNGTTIELWFVDGDTTTSGNQGARANWYVTNFSRQEPLEDVVIITAQFKPASGTANAPEWKIVP